MPTYIHAERPIRVTTPLGGDDLLMAGFTGQEAISQLFSFRMSLLAKHKTEVPFDKLLGQKCTIHLTLPAGKKRHFNGICRRVSQGEQLDTFTSFWVEIVPQFWLLTRRAQSRIFQHLSVPEILKKVLAGLDVVYELRGTFHPRDYCAQYRETDFAFASRLMEEEGIFYFFKHQAGSHTMVVANTPQSHPPVPEDSSLIYENVLGGLKKEDRIHDWDKVQELRSGKYTLWDHCFELPHKHLEAEKKIIDSVAAGKENHKFLLGVNDPLELYDWPGAYAQRFDGVDRGGGDRPGDLQKIFEDNKRTVEIRMQEDAVPGLAIQGASNCRQLVSGHQFTLQRHFNADGPYVLTHLSHAASQGGDFRSGQEHEFSYTNSFTCLPLALPFRPPRITPRPVVHGSQTAVVVGPPGEEIFTDKYSRVKVQFHWDREGKNDLDSSCWIRVGTPWAGKQWGMIHIPRVGQEVIVDFLEGDPDQPIIVGSVYNAEMMPPYKLPDNKTQSGLKTRSTPKGEPPNFNELRFEDKKDSEYIYFHAEKDFNRVVDNNDTLVVQKDQSIILTQGDQTTRIKQGKIETEANKSIELKVGKNSIKIDKDGITLKGLVIKVEGEVKTEVKGLVVKVEGEALLLLGKSVIKAEAPIVQSANGQAAPEQKVPAGLDVKPPIKV